MKKLITFLSAVFVTVSSFASVVTVTVNGNRNYQVVIDGRTYSLTGNNGNRNTNNKSVTITDLAAGQHSIQVYTGNAARRNTNSELYNSTFNLRPNYDLKIAVNGNNGRVRISESGNNNAYDPYNNGNYNNGNYNNGTNNYRVAMNDATFNTLYQSVRSKWLPGAKYTAAANAFNTATNYFTTAQTRQLIGLLSSESNRLELAKLAYDNVVDPGNFTQLYDLFGTQASRDELDAYIRNYGY